MLARARAKHLLESAMTITIDGGGLDRGAVLAVARGGVIVEAAESAVGKPA